MVKEKYLTIPQLAALLGITRIAVYKKVKKGQIPATKVGRTYVISDPDITSILGNEVSDKAKMRTQMYTMREDTNSRIVNVRNNNVSIVQVRLRRSSVGWVGTRGEYYPTLPTSEQLRPVYGF